MSPEPQKKPGDTLQKFISGPLNYLHYVGLVTAIILVFMVRGSVRETDQALSLSVAQQSNLRNILWVNLLIQRASNMALVAHEKSDPSYSDRAGITAESLNQPLGEIISERSTLQTEHKAAIRQGAEEFQVMLRQAAKDPSRLPGLLAVAEKTGVGLNQIESEGWFRLNEHNQNLLREIRRGHELLMTMLTIFVGYLALLALVLHWKRKAENALREAEAKMLSSARISALGEMAGGVAHEINNPLATISLLTEQVRDALAEKPGENKFVMERLEKIGATIKRISRIVIALRTFSRDGDGDPFEAVLARDILDAAFCLCQEKLKQKGVAVAMDVVPADLCVLLQQVQFSQVLLNLFSNACDAVEDLPERWIRVSVAEVAGGIIRFKVSDSGKGIPKAVREKLFNPFFTTKEIGKGTGLGLSVSLGIIKNHGGRLYIDAESVNTTFVIDLPRSRAAPVVASA